jgi:hypothetical protein
LSESHGHGIYYFSRPLIISINHRFRFEDLLAFLVR